MSGDIGSYVKQNLNKWLSGEVFWDFLSSKLYSYTYHMQKILYYIQRELLQSGIDGFDDEIQAWQFGPVVPEVYRQYCGFGAIPIRMKYDVEIGPEYTNIIDSIIEQKRILNPWDMVTDIHQAGKAWSLIYREGLGSYTVIPKDLIRTAG